MPDGFEHLRDEQDVMEAVIELKRRRPEVRRMVVKLNEGFSGEGNAVFPCEDAPEGRELAQWVRDELPRRIRFEASDESWERYCHKFTEMGGIVECFVEGTEVRSPSVQCRIDPLGEVTIISTHDQVLGGPHGQTGDAEVEAQLPLGGDRLPDREPLDQLEHLVARLGLLGHPDGQVVSASPSAPSSCLASYSADRQVVNTNTSE
jgi:hypothetical protein